MLDNVDFITVGDSNVLRLTNSLSSFGASRNFIQSISGGYVNERMFNTVRSAISKASNKFLHVTLHLGGNDLIRLVPDLVESNYVSFLTSLSKESLCLRKHCIFTICSVPTRLSRSVHDTRNWSLSDFDKFILCMERLSFVS